MFRQGYILLKASEPQESLFTSVHTLAQHELQDLKCINYSCKDNSGAEIFIQRDAK